MKLSIVAALALIAALPALQAGSTTALEALQVVREKNSSAGQLIEMRGERGEPQPQQWTLLFNDSKARGGVREFVVVNKEILSERTPMAGYAGTGNMPAIPASRFKFDSSSAFLKANNQAESNKIGFNWIDYTLRSIGDASDPVWTLKLVDNMGTTVGTIEISAETGEVIAPLDVADVPRRDEETSSATSTVTKPVGGLIGEVGSFTKRTAKKVSDTTLRTIGTVQEVLTGDRTIGPKDDEE